MKKTLTAVALTAFALAGCSGDDMPDTTFNAYFYYPDSRELFLGEVKGLEACRTITREKAWELNMIGEKNWTHACCMKTKDSNCAQQYY